jgi:hypothetical protein
VSHFLAATLGAAAVGALLAAVVFGLLLGNRWLAEPHDLRERETVLVAGTGLGLGLVFGAMAAPRLAPLLGVGVIQSLAIVLLGVWTVATAGAVVAAPLVRRYLVWSRTPQVLREYEWGREGDQENGAEER